MKKVSSILLLLILLLGISSMAFASVPSNVPSIILDFTQPGNNGWNWNTFLTAPDTKLASISMSSHVSETADYYMDHEERPHIPRPSTQADVAAGVGITTVGIAVVNALTKTSIFGNASFNGSFNPSAPASPAPVSPAPANSSGGGFFGIIKDFFKNLFTNLREMLTDEGRSYARGRLSENLENIIPIDIEKD